MSRLIVALSLVSIVAVQGPSATGTPAADSLIGSRPTEWQIGDWLNTESVELGALRGRVVLVRWWTTGCMLCATSTGSMNILHDRYASDGLFVAALYHHKAEDALDVAAVHDYARRFDYRFPIGIDHEWRTLKSWWLGRGQQNFTSVSFLIDREGIIRYVHRGGRLAPDSAEFDEIESLIQQLLSEENA